MMNDAQPPIANERTADVAPLGAPAAHAAKAIVQGQARIVYGYWAGAVALGIAIWAALFYLVF